MLCLAAVCVWAFHTLAGRRTCAWSWDGRGGLCSHGLLSLGTGLVCRSCLCTLSTYGAFGQVATVDAKVPGLTGPELRLWNSMKHSEWLASKSVGSFLGLANRDAQRDLLIVASGSVGSVLLHLEAQVLADALVALLAPGALARGRGS